MVVYYNADYARDPKGTNYVRNRILKVAKKLADENIDVRFAISNAKDFREDLSQFGINDAKKDAKYVLARGPKDEKYQMSGDFRYGALHSEKGLYLSSRCSYEALEDFARQLVQGKLEPYLKSQPIPEQTGDVKIVVAKNFEQIVNDKTKDVLIEFYAPW